MKALKEKPLKDPTTSYQDHSIRSEKQYKDAFSEWAKNDPVGYAEAVRLGVAGPKIESLNAGTLQSVEKEDEETRFEVAFYEAPIALDPVDRILEAGDSREAIEDALGIIKSEWEGASASREADAILEVICLLGASKASRDMRIKARVLRTIIGRNDESLSDIARDFGITRADASKIARTLTDTLNLKTTTTTRSAAFVQQCKERATRIHALTKADRKKASNKI
jgi:hypothetical protein